MNQPKSELKIDGMTCGHCQRAVEQALARVAGVAEVKVDLQRGTASVSGSANSGALVTAVQEEGYEARLIGPSEHHD
ncbi:MAG: heavy-metal-associated domain-containing protein [Planctomycetota bacterium]|jgi:copper chaperone